MTIALGILGPFGIVIAADSEEGTLLAGDLKSNANKITGQHTMTVANPLRHKAILVSGSGDSGYLAAIKQHLIDDFSNSDLANIEEADNAVRNRISNFYADHVIPFSSFEADLSVELVIGASVDGEQRLWKTYMNTVRAVPSFEVAAAGAGESWVTNAIPVAASMDICFASAAAAYGIFFAKEHATGCGKRTRMAMLRNGNFVISNQQAVDRLESVFKDFSAAEGFTRNTALGMASQAAFAGMDERLNELRLRIAEEANKIWPSLAPSISQTSGNQQETSKQE